MSRSKLDRAGNRRNLTNRNDIDTAIEFAVLFWTSQTFGAANRTVLA
jgi:hypothetical protein